MTQQQKVKAAIQAGKKSIQDIALFTQILRPNIRRILGQGEKNGIFKRLNRGVYELRTSTGERRAYVELGKAQEVLPEMAAAGHKFDMVFLDPAYFSRALIGGNRGIKKYAFIYADEFAIAMKAIVSMMRTPDSHIYLMLSGAKTAQVDMNKYVMAALSTGLQIVDEGKYSKLFKDGSPVTNVRGEVASSERLLLFTQSGNIRTGDSPVQMNYEVIRPSIKNGYPTEKSAFFIDQVIDQSTNENDIILDPFAGSGIVGEMGLLKNRIAYMVEALKETIENFILPKIAQFV